MRERELRLEEIEQVFPDEWVLMEETAWDKQGNPIRGRVHAHSRNRAELTEALRKLRGRPNIKTFIFYTGEKIPKDLVVL